MNIYKLLFSSFIFLMLFGCTPMKYYLDDSNPVIAQVGDEKLYLTDIAGVFENNVNNLDSTVVVDEYISDWIKTELKLREAKKLFSDNQSDIDLLVERYRNSLLLYKFENVYTSKVDTTILHTDIVEYYNANKYQFKLTSAVVKARVLVLPKEYKYDEKLVEKLNSSSMDSYKDILSIAQRDNLLFYDFDSDWVYFSGVTRYIPLQNINYVEYLSKNKKDVLSDEKNIYLLRIFKYMKAGDDMPIKFVYNDIKKLIISQRRWNTLKMVEDSIMSSTRDEDTIFRIKIDSTVIKKISNLKK